MGVVALGSAAYAVVRCRMRIFRRLRRLDDTGPFAWWLMACGTVGLIASVIDADMLTTVLGAAVVALGVTLLVLTRRRDRRIASVREQIERDGDRRRSGGAGHRR